MQQAVTEALADLQGETLSGGQKQRLVLARAVYSDSDVYLMDDPLSGLDVHVGAKVYAQVIGPLGILGNKVRCMFFPAMAHED